MTYGSGNQTVEPVGQSAGRRLPSRSGVVVLLFSRRHSGARGRTAGGLRRRLAGVLYSVSRAEQPRLLHHPPAAAAAAAAAAVGRPAPWSRPSGLKHTQAQTADGQVRLRLSADQTRLLRADQAVEVRPNCRWPGQTGTRSREAQEIANMPAVPVFDSFL